MALDRGARYMSVLVTVGDRSTETCTPAGATGTGCSVVSVPPLGAGVIRFVPAESLDALLEETVPTASPTLAPSVAPSVTPTISPSAVTSISPATTTSVSPVA
jgi:hypothetical protein